ncbi:TetR family transcriptional regulator C-terminal domain-containing protein [Curtobacterium sp. MCSS17_007]|uniref:TetR/AcrR family transcriptional regulator n=1 Tax=Curtobacterium sp. MCSS17_007 TaxID=2175646 RepID=UPI000DA81A2D|nr:TetR family transcriptional regulator C-terminal domain-containing protein [Curtobacterium sp. MCSS17_007]WIE76943.1 TetR family transcriptional regulator C-terminal domain-containing protein [Curtobacterium sp. MCSS17_007]
MPRLIDHDERDREIGEAAWRVLSRDGLAALSVRNVAEEAGIATASLRRAFPTQDALRVACLRRVFEHVQRRLDALHAARGPGDDPVEFVVRCLRELLPLDLERRTEAEVWVTLGSLALTDDAVRAAYDDAHALLSDACAALLSLARTTAVTDDRVGSGTATDAARLHALVDGLALHLVHAPADADTAWAVDVLTTEVRRLAAPRAG